MTREMLRNYIDGTEPWSDRIGDEASEMDLRCCLEEDPGRAFSIVADTEMMERLVRELGVTTEQMKLMLASEARRHLDRFVSEGRLSGVNEHLARMIVECLLSVKPSNILKRRELLGLWDDRRWREVAGEMRQGTFGQLDGFSRKRILRMAIDSRSLETPSGSEIQRLLANLILGSLRERGFSIRNEALQVRLALLHVDTTLQARLDGDEADPQESEAFTSLLSRFDISRKDLSSLRESIQNESDALDILVEPLNAGERRGPAGPMDGEELERAFRWYGFDAMPDEPPVEHPIKVEDPEPLGTVTLDASGIAVGPTAGGGSFRVFATPGDWRWKATVDCGWVTITTSSEPEGASVVYRYEANRGLDDRIARIAVEDATFELRQAASPAIETPQVEPTPLPRPPKWLDDLVAWIAPQLDRQTFPPSIDPWGLLLDVDRELLVRLVEFRKKRTMWWPEGQQDAALVMRLCEFGVKANISEAIASELGASASRVQELVLDRGDRVADGPRVQECLDRVVYGDTQPDERDLRAFRRGDPLPRRAEIPKLPPERRTQVPAAKRRGLVLMVLWGLVLAVLAWQLLFRFQWGVNPWQ